MRIPNYAINGLGLTVVSPDDIPTFTGCVVGGVDAAGNTIANCPPAGADYTPCLTGAGPLGPGQSYCTPPTTNIPVCPTNQVVSGSCVCPAGTALDPTSMMCLGATASPSIIPGILNSLLYAGAGILLALMILPALAGGGRRR